MRSLGIVVLALVATGCKKGPSCDQQKKTAANAVREARIAASDTTQEQKSFDEANARVEELRAFQVRAIAAISTIRSTTGCDAVLICCKKAQEWIDAHAAAAQEARPLWRLPPFGDIKMAPLEIRKQIEIYDAAAVKLAAELAKGPTATVEEVTAVCEEANKAIDLVRSLSPHKIPEAVQNAESDRSSRALALEGANSRATIYLQWEDAIAKGTKFEVPTPVPNEPTKVAEARAAAKSVQGCLK